MGADIELVTPRPSAPRGPGGSPLRWKLKEVAATCKRWPWIAAFPILKLIALLVITTAVVSVVSDSTIASSRDAAQSFTNDAANYLRSQITWSFAPTQVLALMARQNPDWQNLQRMFPLVVKWTEQSDTNVFDGSALILSPHGVTTEIHPLTEVNRAGLGLSAFNRSDLREAGREADAEAERAAAIAAINDQMAPTITGPFELQLPNGASGTVIQIRVPIVIDNVTDPGERFGLDFDAPVDCRGDADCERRLYDPESKQKFWGFALGVSSIDAVLSAELRDLKQAGYAYRLVALRPDGSEDPAAAAAPITQSDGYAQAVRQPPRASRWSPPMTPVQSDVVVLQGLVRWRLYAVPVDGWVPAWRSWVLAWMVIGSSLLSGLTFLLLLSQKNHQELLRALLPQQMIRGMRQAAALSARHAEAQAALLGSTPAEKVLQMLACLLDGRPPELQDIMLVRAAIMQGYDMYQPMNLDERLQSAELDTDVAMALMHQLGTGTARATSTVRHKVLMTAAEDSASQGARSSLSRGSSVTTTDAVELANGSALLPSPSGLLGGKARRNSGSQRSIVTAQRLSAPNGMLPIMQLAYGAAVSSADVVLGTSSACGGGGGGGGGGGLKPVFWSGLGLKLSPHLLHDETERLLAQAAGGWSFDVFALTEATAGRPLSTLAFYLIRQQGLSDHFQLDESKLARFLTRIEAGHQCSNPYHNAIHVASVVHCIHAITTRGGLMPHYVGPHAHLALYLAATIHDYDHGGLTNDFLVATQDPLALLYNDRSPLENHHLAAAFTVLRHPSCNFLDKMPPADVSQLRKLMIELVIATDMKQHMATISRFTSAHHISSGAAVNVDELAAAAAAAAAAPRRPLDDAERLLSLQMAMKCADLGHLAAPLPLHLRWVSCLEEEFFQQGDREAALGLPISPLFDRRKPGVTKSQVGFFDFVVLPLYTSMATVFPALHPLVASVQENHLHWRSKSASASGNES